MIAVPPVGLEEIAPEWIEERREIVAREGRALRPGRGASIEIKSLTPHEQLAAHDPLWLNDWLLLALPGGATECRTPAERDTLLARLVAPVRQAASANTKDEPRT